MIKRIAIYGGTALSAAESLFIELLTYGLLTNGEIVIITGGFLYWPEKMPGAISTDFSVLQGAKKYAHEKGLELKDVLETWLPDPHVETDTDKKSVVRFKEGAVKELMGESAQARRFSMIRNVDVIITVKGKKHTSMVLDFAVTINKPAFPLPFTGGDSQGFWNTQKDRIQKWFNIDDDLATEMEIKDMEESWDPEKKSEILRRIITAVNSGLESEAKNQQYYRRLQEEFAMKKDLKKNREEVRKKKQLKMFLSYAHKDVDLKDELDVSLIALKRDERVSIWQDTDNIHGGDQWNEKIEEGLQNADIVLLLVSPDFIDSEYIWNKELPIIKQKYDLGKTKVIPIFLRDVFAKNMWFTDIQGYISLDKPIAGFKDYDRDTAFKKVVQGISDVIDNLLNEEP